MRAEHRSVLGVGPLGPALFAAVCVKENVTKREIDIIKYFGRKMSKSISRKRKNWTC